MGRVIAASPQDDAALLREVEAMEAEAARLEAEATCAQVREADVCSESTALSEQLQRRESEARKLRADAVTLQRLVEEEEEFITNGLIKRLDALKKNKLKLAQQVEAEEDFLTNSLQRQLTQMVKEKDELEKHLTKERRFIVGKLRRQIKDVADQRNELERRLAWQRANGGDSGSDAASGAGSPGAERLLDFLRTYQNALGERRDSVCGNVDSDTESSVSAFSESTQHSGGIDATSRKMQKEILRLQHVKCATAEAADGNAQKCEALRQQLRQLSQDNIIREAKSLKLQEELARASVAAGIRATPPTTPRLPSPRSGSCSGSSTPTVRHFRRTASQGERLSLGSSGVLSKLASTCPGPAGGGATRSPRHTPRELSHTSSAFGSPVVSVSARNVATSVSRCGYSSNNSSFSNIPVGIGK